MYDQLPDLFSYEPYKDKKLFLVFGNTLSDFTLREKERFEDEVNL